MEIKIGSMVDTQRLILMTHGEIFIWHIEQHLAKGDTGSKDITKGKVGCKICGKSTQHIFEADKDAYYKYMNDKYKED